MQAYLGDKFISVRGAGRVESGSGEKEVWLMAIIEGTRNCEIVFNKLGMNPLLWTASQIVEDSELLKIRSVSIPNESGFENSYLTCPTLTVVGLTESLPNRSASEQLIPKAVAAKVKKTDMVINFIVKD